MPRKQSRKKSLFGWPTKTWLDDNLICFSKKKAPGMKNLHGFYDSRL